MSAKQQQQTLTPKLSLAPPLKTEFIFEIDYKKMYHNVKRCNEIVLHKLEKARRSAGYWKREHAELIDALWGWTTTRADNNKPLYTQHPVKPKKKKSAAAPSFTFPPEREMKDPSQPPSSPTRVLNQNLHTPSKTTKRKAPDVSKNKKKTLRKRLKKLLL